MVKTSKPQRVNTEKISFGILTILNNTKPNRIIIEFNGSPFHILLHFYVTIFEKYTNLFPFTVLRKENLEKNPKNVQKIGFSISQSY